MEHRALGYCFSRKDLFRSFPVEKLELFGKKNTTSYDNVHSKDLVGKIFVYGLYLILLDIIHNGITFKFPTKKDVTLHMKSITGEDFKKSRRNGAFLDVDYLKSNFTGNIIVYSKIIRDRMVDRDIHVNKELKQLITKYTNEGRGYA